MMTFALRRRGLGQGYGGRGADRLKRKRHNLIGPFLSRRGFPDENDGIDGFADRQTLRKNQHTGTALRQDKLAEFSRHGFTIMGDQHPALTQLLKRLGLLPLLIGLHGRSENPDSAVCV
jgi:hypothetical protein